MAPPNRKGGLTKRRDSILPSTTEESQDTGVCKENAYAMISREAAKSSYSTKRKSRLNVPFKSHEDSFIAILKKNARDLTVVVTSDDDLVLSFKTTKQDLGILHATKNQLVLPWRKSGGSCEHNKIAMRAGVHRVEMSGLKSQAEHLALAKPYEQNDSGSKLKVSSFSIVSESNENLKVCACSVIPKERKEEAKVILSGFGVAIAGTSKAYDPIHSTSECAINDFDSPPFSSDENESLSLNSDEDCVVMSSSISDRKHRKNTTIVRRASGKSCCLNLGKLYGRRSFTLLRAPAP